MIIPRWLVKVIFFLSMLNFCWAEKVLSQKQPPVPKVYQNYFAHFEDNRSLPERVFNKLDVTLGDFGRSFALIAGVYEYPNYLTDPELEPAKEDLRKLEEYLRDHDLCVFKHDFRDCIYDL